MAILSGFVKMLMIRGKAVGAESISWLHYLTVAICLIATVTAWQMSLAGVKERTRLQFDRQADDVIQVFEEQMRRYADVLLAGVGFVSASEKILPDEWQEFTERMDVKERHPALSSFAVIYRVMPDEVIAFEQEQQSRRSGFRIFPAVDTPSAQSQPYYLPVAHVSPREREEFILGLDVARESRRLDAVLRAMDSGEVQITAPLQLGRLGEPGILLIAPIYQSGIPLSVESRRKEFRGAIVGSIYTQNLTTGLLNNGKREVALKVSDGDEVMYNEQIAAFADIDPDPLLVRSQEVSFLGRVWRFDVHGTLSFRKAQHRLEPTLILVAGLIINALLLYLLAYMAQAHGRAMVFGQKIADKYHRQTEKLHLSNAALEELNEGLRSFSYVVSHDLKAPLIGIAALARCIEEDLVEHLPASDAKQPEFVRRLRLIQKQVVLSQGLITGILEYSGLGVDVENPETVNVRELLNSIRVMLAVEEAQLQLVGDFPLLETFQTQLFQVFMNLISNSYKYHDKQKEAVVTISTVASQQTGFYRFVVSDNGPGIDPENHEKIFEVFSTLQPKNHSMSSGVGLAIVKKLVNRHGGKVHVESVIGQGASFRFDWPCEIDQPGIADSDVLPKAA